MSLENHVTPPQPAITFPPCWGYFNGKGGVGKTTTTANTAGLLAAAGYRVLVFELDPQGNLSRDLGYDQTDGTELFTSLLTETAPPRIYNAGGRQNLDVVPCGEAVFDIGAVIAARAARGNNRRLGQVIREILEPIADQYDMILFDTPPGDITLIDAALEVVNAVVIPVKADDASLDGMATIAKRFVAVRDGDESTNTTGINPNLQLGGVSLFGVASRASKLEQAVRETIYEIVGDSAPVFDARIRSLETAAFDARRRGLLFHELEEHAETAKAARFAALKKGAKPADVLLSRNASGVAGDFAALAHEIVARVGEIIQQQQEEVLA